jgi:hypothetical protein
MKEPIVRVLMQTCVLSVTRDLIANTLSTVDATANMSWKAKLRSPFTGMETAVYHIVTSLADGAKLGLPSTTRGLWWEADVAKADCLPRWSIVEMGRWGRSSYRAAVTQFCNYIGVCLVIDAAYRPFFYILWFAFQTDRSISAHNCRLRGGIEAPGVSWLRDRDLCM